MTTWGLAGPEPAPVPPPPGVLWSADMETGDLSQWDRDEGGGVYATGTGEAAADATRAHSGTHSLRLSIRGADGTTGNQAIRVFRWSTAENAAFPDEAYYSAWFLFPERATPTQFWNVFQWKTKITDDLNDPTFIITVGNRPTGAMYLYLFDWIVQAEQGASPVDLPTGRWVHIEARYRWSTTDEGRVTVWQDGEQIIDVEGVRTMYESNDPNARAWSVNNYTDGIAPPSMTIYVDDAAISTERLGPGAQAPG